MKCYRRFFLLAILSLLNVALTKSQIQYDNIRFKQLGFAEGLPHNTVNAITQDNQGYLWFGTRNGLCKYDGYALKHYYHSDNDTTSLRHDFILKLYTDTINNKLWISTDEGICSYNNITETFKSYDIKGNIRNDVSFFTTSTGMLLACCSNGVFRYEPSEDKFLPFILHNKNYIRNIVEDENKNLWIECRNKLLRYNLNSGKFSPIPPILKEHRSRISNIQSVNKRTFLACFNGSIILYNTLENTIYNLPKQIKHNDMFYSTKDSDSNIWIGTEYGIYIVDNKHYNIIKHYEDTYGNISKLNDSPIYSIYKDRDENIWIGTYFGGINYYISGSEHFRIYPYGNTDNHLSGKAVRQIIGSQNGRELIATEDGGLNIMNNEKKIFKSEQVFKNLNINTQNIHSLMYDSKNTLWIGLFLNGIVNYNEKTKRCNVFNQKEAYLSSAFFITESSNNKIFYGGPNGIYHINKEQVVKRISPITSFCSLNETDTTFLIGTRKNGICRLNSETFKLDTLHLLPHKNLFVTNIYRDSKGYLWVGTNNNGIYILDKEYKISKTFNKELIVSNGIKGIIEDDNHNMWIGTDNGLIRINMSNWYISRYTTSDGLPTNQFNYSSAFKSEDGEIFMGTINGMISFFPELIKRKKQNFKVEITDIISNSEKVSPLNKDYNIIKTHKGIEEITLSHSQAQSLRIEYSGMNYQYTYGTKYKMYIDGLDKEWQYVDNQHQVRFSNLPAGKYTLKIIAGYNGTEWDKNGLATLKINVLPPWYLSIWAYMIYTIIVILCLYAAYRYTKSRLRLLMRLENEHNQRMYIEKLNKQKTDFFTYISHDLKTPLTLILSPLQKLITQNEISNKDKKNIETIYRNANRMHYLIDEILTFSKIEMNQMHITVRKGNIISFLGEISHIFDIVSKEKEIDFTLNLEDIGKEVWFSPSKLERIMYNLLSNAFKYSQAGDTVTLSAHLKEENDSTYAVISVKDTGRGIPKEMLDKIFESYYQVEKKDHRECFGLGLSLTRSLIQMHKGDIKVESEVGVGTVFTVTLNVSENAYTKDEKAIESISQDEIQKYNQRMRDTIELIPDKLVDEDKKNDKETIMIVEDNKEMNEYICDIFKDKYNVMRASNGEEAYKMLSKRIPNIIVSDIMMPKVDGLEFTRLVKQDVSTSHIPVILLTAKTDEKDHTEGYKCGAEAYIAKPFNAQNLELLIENIQNNRRKVIERFKQAEEMNVTQVTNNPRDEKFMKELVDLIMKNISQEDFGVTEITAEMHISRSLLHTKLKSLTGCSITQFMRTIRMKEARTHLMNGMNVSEAAYAVGMSDPNYFTKCFKKEFDITPSEFLKQITAESNKQ